jgi:flagellar export protein FliJ
MSARDDRGLEAVRRVREARERDSRIGLQQALTSAQERETDAATARRRLAAVPAFDAGTAADYRAHALFGRALAENADEKQEQARRSATIAAEARRRWARDRQAMRMVELLLERRAEERRAERARREAADLDDLATQGWLRNRPTPEVDA